MAQQPRKTSKSVKLNKDKYISISELSNEFNVTPRTIRHYEDEGLLEPERRGQSRLFTQTDRERLDVILTGARLGIHLAKLREIFDLYDNTRGDDKRARQLALLLAEQRGRLQQQQHDIERMQAELARMEQRCRRQIEVEPEPRVRRDGAQADLFG